jgi:hypothetical protein
MMAMLSGQPIFELSTVEAEMLGNAVYDVAEEYGISLSGPRAVWIKLAAAVGMVYGPRAMVVMQQNAARSRLNGVRPTTPATPAPDMGQMGPFNFAGVPQ